MKKLILSTVLFFGLIFSNLSDAAAQSFQKDDLIINAGIGVGGTYSWAGLGLPLGGGVEYGVSDLEVGSIGVGGDLGFVSGSGLTITYIGGRASYHFNELFEVENEELDIYGGLGIYYSSFSYSGGGSFANGMIASFHAGTRYYLSDNVGIYGELGNNWGWLNIGAIFKL